MSAYLSTVLWRVWGHSVHFAAHLHAHTVNGVGLQEVGGVGLYIAGYTPACDWQVYVLPVRNRAGM